MKRSLIIYAITISIVAIVWMALCYLPTAAQPVKQSSSLLTGLISYWKLDEESGVRYDEHGSNDLTDNNTVGYTSSAVINNAATLIKSNSEYLSHADTADLSIDDQSFTIAAWFTLHSFTFSYPYYPVIVGKGGYGGAIEYWLYWTPTGYNNGYACIQIRSSVGGGSLCEPIRSYQLNTWSLAIAWRDNESDTMYIQVNNSTIYTAASEYTQDGTGTFNIGNVHGGASYWDGDIDEVGFWKRVLTPAERCALYNGGAGLAYPFNDSVTSCDFDSGCGEWDGSFNESDTWTGGTWVSPTYRTLYTQTEAINTWFMSAGYYTATIGLRDMLTDDLDIDFVAQHTTIAPFRTYCKVEMSSGDTFGTCQLYIRYPGYYQFSIGLYDEGNVTLDNTCLNWEAPAPQPTYTPNPTYTPQPTYTPYPTLTPYPTWYPWISPLGTPTPFVSIIPTPRRVLFK